MNVGTFETLGRFYCRCSGILSVLFFILLFVLFKGGILLAFYTAGFILIWLARNLIWNMSLTRTLLVFADMIIEILHDFPKLVFDFSRFDLLVWSAAFALDKNDIFYGVLFNGIISFSVEQFKVSLRRFGRVCAFFIFILLDGFELVESGVHSALFFFYLNMDFL